MLSMSVIPAIMLNKKRRQLIIVSHSAPIVVNGDAEYVISMQHDRTGLYPGLCGALQESPLKALICRQMEGEKKRFVRGMNVFLVENETVLLMLTAKVLYTRSIEVLTVRTSG